MPREYRLFSTYAKKQKFLLDARGVSASSSYDKKLKTNFKVITIYSIYDSPRPRY